MKLDITVFFVLINTFSVFSQSQSKKKSFVSYWSKGDNYDFKITKVKQQWRESELIKNDSTQYIANFKVIDSTASSYKIKWSYKTDLKNTYNIPDELLQKFAKYEMTGDYKEAGKDLVVEVIGKVNKGYLSDGINIEENGLLLNVENKEDFHSYLKFTTDLSVAINKEIGAFILDSDSGFDDLYISRFKESKPHSAEGLENFIKSDSYSIKNKELNLSGNKHKANAWFHTHPDIMSSDYGSSKPSPDDRNTTKTLQIPGAVLGGWGGIGLINTDGTFKRWGN